MNVKRRKLLKVALGCLVMALLLAACSETQREPSAVVEPEPPPSRPLIQDTDTTERVLEMLGEDPDADIGVYLKEVGGPIHAAANETFKFEPASTIKALVHFHALRWAQDQAQSIDEVLDDTIIQRDTGTCPAGDESETLCFALSEMMGPSSNFWTEALREHFGNAAIDATRQALGMNDTQLERVLGCGGQPGGFGADPNQPSNHLTLVDAGTMYEAVATGFLNPVTRAVGFPGQIMVRYQSQFNTITDEEAVGLGLSADALASVKAQQSAASKPGGVTLQGKRYSSVAGWVSLAFKDADCQITPREFAYGVFRHGADLDLITVSVATAGTEMFREQIREALESWAACEADLEIISSSLVDPPDEVDVNTPVTLTVRHQVRNNGPAESIDAQVTTVATAPEDCTVTPGNPTHDVFGLEIGDERDVLVGIELECSDPSFHLFQVNATIAPLNSNVIDPNPDNNEAATSATIALIAYADLAILDWDLAELENAGLQDFLVGQPFTFSTPKLLHNFGDTDKGLYHAPIDATLSASLEIPAGIRGAIQDGNVTVWLEGPTTVSRDVAVLDLEVGADRAISETFGLHCLEPGLYDITLTNELWADDEHILDPDPSNNLVQVQREIECLTPVQINIRPGNSHNFINPNSRQSVPVAILTTEAGEYDLPLAFGATTVDHTTTRFGTVETLNAGGGTMPSPNRAFIRDSFEMDDKTKDGDLDMVLHFNVPGSGIDQQSVEACLVGTYLGPDDGLFTFFGCDVVQIIP